MADEQTNSILMGAGIGGGFGLIGAGAISLRESMTRSQVLSTLILGTGFGCSCSVGAMCYWQINPMLCIVIGWIAGLSCIGLLATVLKISSWISKKPWALIPQLKDMANDEAKPGDPK